MKKCKNCETCNYSKENNQTCQNDFLVRGYCGIRKNFESPKKDFRKKTIDLMIQ